MATYLDRILATHREMAAADGRRLDELSARAASAGRGRGFAAALVAEEGLSVIAEIKRRSPSAGVLADGLDPADMGRRYARGGAACLSVLTDSEFFGGSPDDLVAASRATGLPVLRKDFTTGPADVYDTRLMGADAVLLIAAALSQTELVELSRLAASVGLDALVEVHDEDEVARALDAGATLIGVNQRDLYTFEVDADRARRIAKLLPDAVVRVAESGVRRREEATALADAGYHAVLVGECLVRAVDPTAAVRDLTVRR